MTTLIRYKTQNFRPASLEKIAQAVEITDEYTEAGYTMTIRQLYYQFVARDLISNNQREYNKLKSLMGDARLAGMLSWAAIVDRTRNLKSNNHWDSPADLLSEAAGWYGEDLWAGQSNRVEVWIEKDALVGVIDKVCRNNDCPFFSCRGYTSISEMWSAGMRMCRRQQDDFRGTHIIHLGDHDPSGIDMTRDISERLAMFCNRHGCDGPTVHRVALNMDQVVMYDPPPNPTKMSDARAQGYIAEHGYESWELDALDPKTLDTIIRDKINSLRDADLWNAAVQREQDSKDRIEEIASEECST